MDEHLGIGPDGSNPLGFLCAVGAFVTLDSALPESKVRMSWRWQAGWRPVWHLSGISSHDDLTAAVCKTLSGKETAPEFTLGGNDNLTLGPHDFRGFATDAAAKAGPANRRWADFMSAYGSDAVVRRDRGKAERVEVTAFRFTSGQQGFLDFMRQLSRLTKAEDIEAALFSPWKYSDNGPSMRWDPAMDDRRYALRADDPSTSKQLPIRTVRGANRLAIEALPCFPSVPVGRHLETACFMGRVTRGLYFSWPLWEPAISAETMRALLNLTEITAARPDRRLLKARGITAVFRCRVAGGYYRNFAPAITV
jgi:hypothetical protein